MKETIALQQVIDILNEYADQLRYSRKTKEADAVRKSISYLIKKEQESRTSHDMD